MFCIARLFYHNLCLAIGGSESYFCCLGCRYSVLASVDGFDRLRLLTKSPAQALKLLLRGQLPMQFASSPKVYVLQRQGH
jgi:hypothetical protein